MQPPEILELLEQAERQLNEDAMKSWFQARANPDAWKAYRRGMEALRMRFKALLTGGQ
jgi:hypothetical protein